MIAESEKDKSGPANGLFGEWIGREENGASSPDYGGILSPATLELAGIYTKYYETFQI